MKVKIAWISLDDVQTKNFKTEADAINWIKKQHENIAAINACLTAGTDLKDYEILGALQGSRYASTPTSADIGNLIAFKRIMRYEDIIKYFGGSKNE